MGSPPGTQNFGRTHPLRLRTNLVYHYIFYVIHSHATDLYLLNEPQGSSLRAGELQDDLQVSKEVQDSLVEGEMGGGPGTQVVVTSLHALGTSVEGSGGGGD